MRGDLAVNHIRGGKTYRGGDIAKWRTGGLVDKIIELRHMHIVIPVCHDMLRIHLGHHNVGSLHQIP